MDTKVEKIPPPTLELYRRLVEGIGNEYCIYSTDIDGIWLYLSPSAREVLGYPPKSLLGNNWREIWTPEFAAPAIINERKMKAGLAPPTYEMHYVHPDGTQRTFQISEKPVLDATGNTIAIEGILVDITRRLKAQEDLRKANDSLELLNQELENRVLERTTDLEHEIEVRRGVERDLRQALDELAGLKARLEVENTYLQEEIQRTHGFDEIVGESDVLRKALDRVLPVAATDATVLILGETGTGKELFARAIHKMSRRKDRALVTVNCAALPATIIESELFGHEKGAFTGAFTRKLGRFEVADGGTIFLDEIGDLQLELQAKLLRVLQQGEFERVGSSITQKVDVRVIAATNRDLRKDAKENRFRADLFYRLSVFPISVPPLRERRADIPLLVWHFIKKLQGRWGKTIQQVPPEVMQSLQAYSWPGNVRELENVIERATILSSGPQLTIDEPPEQNDDGPSGPTSTQSLEDVERAHILQVLESCGWKISGKGNTADRVGMNASTFRSRMKKLGIRKPGS
jgi:PAS domain S-box-containing protein